MVGHFDLRRDEGALGVAGVVLKHLFGTRHGGVTSAGGWVHTDGRWGLMLQNDELELYEINGATSLWCGLRLKLKV
ncbi:MAG: hypothetical protein IPJ65_22525 [Archangiaceae bacterium]|nr:hypothetical protein [Archangiaceae bacterium]